MDKSSSPEEDSHHTSPNDTLYHTYASHNLTIFHKEHHIENPAHSIPSPPPPSHIGTGTPPKPGTAGTHHHGIFLSTDESHNPIPVRIDLLIMCGPHDWSYLLILSNVISENAECNLLKKTYMFDYIWL